MAYLLHSIIVFFDMILIHMFTHSTWLSVTGEVVTYIHVLLFHFTKESVWELLETVFLAVLSSMYMINSRREALQERDALTMDVDALRERGALLLRNIHQVHAAILEKHENSADMRQSVMVQMEREKSALEELEKGSLRSQHNDVVAEKEQNDSTHGTEVSSDVAEDTELTRELLKPGECSCPLKTFKKRLNVWLQPFHEQNDEEKGSEGDNDSSGSQTKKSCQRAKCYREMFFDYFLDGAAGVMYTSFLGLIIDAFFELWQR